MFRQRTLKRAIHCTGLGLHTGRKINLTLCPAEEGRGIVFVRTDIPKRVEIEACVNNVVDTKLATTLGKDGVRISTVEHLLAALYGLGIDNLIIEVDGPEVPIMDGSSAPFVYLIHCAGIEEQCDVKRFMIIKKRIEVTSGDKWISLMPSQDSRITYTIDFAHPLLRSQTLSVTCDTQSFHKDICKARTFGFLKDVELMRSMGLAQGGSLDNAIVIDEFRILNEEGLRYKDEFVRHKILDLFGDLSLFGAYIIGHIKAYKSGHHLNNQLARKILSSPQRYELFTPSVDEEIKRGELRFPSFKVVRGMKR